MISTSYLISSEDVGRDGYLSALGRIGAAIGAPSLALTGRFFDGVSDIHVRLAGLEEAGYDEDDLAELENALQGPARALIVFEYDDGETAIPNLLKIVNEMGTFWPIVFDTCSGRLYGMNEMAQLIQDGYF